jgi:hypothetical protein
MLLGEVEVVDEVLRVEQVVAIFLPPSVHRRGCTDKKWYT